MDAPLPAREFAYDRLVAMLGSGELPPGHQLKTADLAIRLGMSRTPVREAISRLVATGVVKDVPGYGTFVPRPSRERLVEIYDLRMVLECYAASEAARHITPGELEQLEELCDRWLIMIRRLRRDPEPMDLQAVKQWIEIDGSFHRVIYAASQNQMLFKTLNDLRLIHLTMRARECSRTLSIRIAPAIRSYRQHASLVRALRKGLADEASACMRRHIAEGKEAHLREFDAGSNVPGELDRDACPQVPPSPL